MEREESGDRKEGSKAYNIINIIKHGGHGNARLPMELGQ